MGTIPTAELCERYTDLHTGVINDALLDEGIDHQVLRPGITPLREDMVVAGEAYPAEGRPNDDIDSGDAFRKLLKMIDEVPDNSVLTLAANDDQYAQIGGLASTALSQNGCHGAVVDGGVRDSHEIFELDFPAFSRYRTPAAPSQRWEILDWNTTVTVGGVEVSPSDIVVGDVDGVVVVPNEMAEDTLLTAEKFEASEEETQQQLLNGKSLYEAFKHGQSAE